MTGEEYKEFTNDFKCRFSDLWLRIERVDLRGVLKTFYEDAFKDLDISDCMRVSRSLTHMGQLPSPAEVCHIYRDRCARMHQQRKPTADYRGAWHEVTKGSMAAAYQKACQIIQEEKSNGYSPEEAIEIMRTVRRWEWSDLV